jgi:DNA-binding NarL/FixJ family response regulator
MPAAAFLHLRPALTLVDPLSVGPRPDPAVTGVVIADGQALVRAGLRALLESEPGVGVLAEAGDLESTLERVSATRAAVLLLDVALPGLDGAADLRRIVAASDAHVVLLLDGSEIEPQLYDALRAGVSGFLLKDARPSELREAVKAVAAGDGVVAPVVARVLLNELAALPETTRPRPDELSELTRRELEVVALVAGGMSNLEIAEYLVISPATAKTHVSRALCKLTARDRAQLVTFAYESGLVVPRAALSAA